LSRRHSKKTRAFQRRRQTFFKAAGPTASLISLAENRFSLNCLQFLQVLSLTSDAMEGLKSV
jgi:hypothetical protein